MAVGKAECSPSRIRQEGVPGHTVSGVAVLFERSIQQVVIESSANEAPTATHLALPLCDAKMLDGEMMMTIETPITPPPQIAMQFTQEEVAAFWRNGYLIVRQLATATDVAQMRRITDLGLREQLGPIEYEADLHYPGAPASLDAVGGRTVRRLKQALSRDFLFTDWITRPTVLGRLKQLLGPQVICPMAHHNCIMTKQPQYSSETGWHQDIRYWSFAKPDLVNTWLALGREYAANGCLQVIPGSHRMELERSRFDSETFFRSDLAENQPMIATKQYVELDPGDVLFFHSKTLHAASRNTTTESKYSAVFTFHGGDNYPLPNSRSAALPELLMTPAHSV